MRFWIGQICAHVLKKSIWDRVVFHRKSARPVRGQAGSAAKHFWVFADGVHRNQAAHTRSCDKGVFPILFGRKTAVDEWFEFMHQKMQVVVGVNGDREQTRWWVAFGNMQERVLQAFRQ